MVTRQLTTIIGLGRIHDSACADDSKTFRDNKNGVGDRKYKERFFGQRQEREFEIKEKGQIGYAMELIKHSFDVSG
ncbi:MAG TPA: hypothetical protein VMT01_01205 [Candidatus Acidoferrum sp.]|nr:hypothetical protein [Candidatus Acidoferrum sp.]